LIPTQDNFGPITGYFIFWIIFLLAMTLFVLRLLKLVSYLNLGRHINRSDNLPAKILAAFTQVVLQRCTLRFAARKDFSGINHAFIFWGFGIFLLSYLLDPFVAGGLGLVKYVHSLYIAPWLTKTADWAGVIIIAMLAWSAFRRYLVRPKRLLNSRKAGIILLWILVLMLAHFLLEGLRINLNDLAPGSRSLFSRAAAGFLMCAHVTSDFQQSLYRVVWWLHYSLIMGFLVYLPYSKHLHLLSAPFNLVFAPNRRVGSFGPAESKLHMPRQDIGFLNWKHLLDVYSCTECGRCQAACPATEAGTPLKPRDMVLNLKDHILKNGPELMQELKSSETKDLSSDSNLRLIGSSIQSEELWACTTCGRCQEECPVLIEHVDRIVSLRRCFVESGKSTGSLAKCLESLSLLGNPWTRSPGERENWATDSNLTFAEKTQHVDILYWVGCTGSYDPKGQEIVRAMVDILNAVGTSFAVLGNTEKCCGEPARRLGEEGLFEKLAKNNIRELRKHNFDKIMTHCPHCYNVIKHEYKEFGGDFEIVHHTEFLAALHERGSLSLGEVESRVTYQDPCYLGRYNGLYEQARSLLHSIPGVDLAEMTNHGDQAVCCGGGGGQLWLDWFFGQRINYQRFSQVQEVQPDELVTACPFCKIMLEDARESCDVKSFVKVADVAELVRSCLLRQQ
jgi:Fe-S oxidoreductase